MWILGFRIETERMKKVQKEQRSDWEDIGGGGQKEKAQCRRTKRFSFILGGH